MNETTPPDGASDVPWAAHVSRIPVPDTSMLPGSETAPPAAVGLLKHAMQGAHDAVDRLADAAVPAVHQLGDRASAAAEAVTVKTRQLRDLSDDWVDGARATVRRHPLTALAAALALGVVIARVAGPTRGSR